MDGGDITSPLHEFVLLPGTGVLTLRGGSRSAWGGVRCLSLPSESDLEASFHLHETGQNRQPNYGYHPHAVSINFFPSLVWLVLGEERGGAVLHLPRYDRVGSWWEGLGVG